MVSGTKVLKWIYNIASLFLYLPTKADHPFLLLGTVAFTIGLFVLWLKG